MNIVLPALYQISAAPGIVVVLRNTEYGTKYFAQILCGPDSTPYVQTSTEESVYTAYEALFHLSANLASRAVTKDVNDEPCEEVLGGTVIKWSTG